jgi:prevent-host-death family protein
MAAKQVSIRYAKTHLLQLLKEAEQGHEIVIAKSGKPVAKLVALQPPFHRAPPGYAKDDPDVVAMVKLFDGPRSVV